tara:strand:- start:118 stop:588 length:471 start_codon:yes stop_codon:yes gene_type:complete
MEIKCDKCSKIFIVDQNLIPHNGRLVQCSNCKNEWFFKPNDKKTEELSQDFNYDNDKINIYNEELETLDFISNNSKDQVSSSVKYDSSIITKEKKRKISQYLKYLLVSIISFIALILIIDTFDVYLKNMFPGIENMLQNFYETLKDVFLFLKDLSS